MPEATHIYSSRMKQFQEAIEKAFKDIIDFSNEFEITRNEWLLHSWSLPETSTFEICIDFRKKEKKEGEND